MVKTVDKSQKTQKINNGCNRGHGLKKVCEKMVLWLFLFLSIISGANSDEHVNAQAHDRGD